MKFDKLMPDSRIEFARAGGFWQDKTVLDYFERNLAQHPERIAVVEHNSMTGSGSRLSYAELERHARAIAAGLARRGV